MQRLHNRGPIPGFVPLEGAQEWRLGALASHGIQYSSRAYPGIGRSLQRALKADLGIHRGGKD